MFGVGVYLAGYYFTVLIANVFCLCVSSVFVQRHIIPHYTYRDFDGFNYELVYLETLFLFHEI